MNISLSTRMTDFLLRNPLLVLLVIIVVGVQLATGSLLQWPNMRSLLIDGAIIAIVAVPCGMLLIAGYIDLSVGSTLALGGVVAGLIMNEGAGSPVVAVLLAVLAGAAVGLFNAVLTCVLGFSSFITTLGTFTAVRGVAQLVSPLPRNSFGPDFGILGVGTLAAIPVSVWIALAALLLGALFLARTPAGRHVYAIGVNREAAYLSGVSIRRIPFVLYVLSGASAALAGTIVVARLNSAPSGQLGVGFELAVLTAVLLGGVALTGGEGTMFGVATGVLFLGILKNSLVLVGVSSFWQSVASGLALVVAIALSVLVQRVRRLLDARAARLLSRAT
jgi:ribose transport system permease protein